VSAEQEMRNVILHAADSLQAAVLDSPGRSPGYDDLMRTAVAAAEAVGVLRLLAAYLAVEDKPRIEQRELVAYQAGAGQ
jgi:hypothetical protein